MEFDTLTAANYAAAKLDSLLERAARDTIRILEQADIPVVITYFAELKSTIAELQSRMSALNKHVDGLSQELIPTLFNNQNVKTIRVDGVGRATVNDRWSCSMLKPDDGIAWLKHGGNGGMVKETVHPMTLGAFAKDEFVEGRPLPNDIFKVSSTPYVSITK
jgi:hypothetical protein